MPTISVDVLENRKSGAKEGTLQGACKSELHDITLNYDECVASSEYVDLTIARVF